MKKPTAYGERGPTASEKVLAVLKHDHDAGDRYIALVVAPKFFDELDAEVRGKQWFGPPPVNPYTGERASVSEQVAPLRSSIRTHGPRGPVTVFRGGRAKMVTP